MSGCARRRSSEPSGTYQFGLIIDRPVRARCHIQRGAIAEGLPNEYDRAYYSGIIQEREATAMISRRADYRSRRAAYTLFQNAMEWYRKAQAIRPRDNDESVLRWNACVRVLERNWGFQ